MFEWTRLSRGGFRRGGEIDPDEIFLDSSNVARFDTSQFEGRVERPISQVAIFAVGGVFVISALIFAGKAFSLQILNGEKYADISKNNRIERSVLFSTRGIIFDRNQTELAWNTPQTNPELASTTPFALRKYIELPGFAHLLGFVRYPKADASGNWWREEYSGIAGAERVFNERLAGTNGSSMSETDARGKLVREDIVDPPKDGDDIHLSIDADVQAELTRVLSEHAHTVGFVGGAAAIMDVETGELLALTSFPEYDNQAFVDGDTEKVEAANVDERKPLLNRAVTGLYTPGSIVKPMFAAAALQEGIISAAKSILSTGSISIPNPYNPDLPSVFRDWKAHGYTDMRRAIAVSSDVYFYAIGGGYQDQLGLGIKRIDEYAKKFGLGSPTGFVFGGEPDGTIPTPEWKEEVFDGDPWRLGDTYNTAIGQYGFQITPLQAVRFTAALANGGTLVTPQLIASSTSEKVPVGISDAHLKVAREGMRQAVTDGGTAAALNMGGISLAGKTGTAQTGTRNQFMNSWVVGFWPYEKPKYAFAVVLEKAPAGTNSGAAPAMSRFFYWLRDTKPEYVE